MIRLQLVDFALEAAIAAQLFLFTGFLMSNLRRHAPALYFLAAIAGSIGFMTAINLLIGEGAWPGLSDINLFLELLLGPEIFLYVRQIRQPPPQLRMRDALQALPAILGLILWETGAVSSMDAYVIVSTFAYLTAALVAVRRNAEGYSPALLQRFLTILLAFFFVIGLLRVAIAFEVPVVGSFREGLPYALLLIVVFLATSLILFTALKYPNLLSAPGSHMKYVASQTSASDLDTLEQQLTELLAGEKPYLDADLSLSQLAARLNAQSRQVSQLINARYGMNFSAYMNFCRVGEASQMLSIRVPQPIKSVMYESGFKSKSIFNREFQRHFGVSPSEYRRRQESASSASSGVDCLSPQTKV
jgi:AraC-like DNA-binding protein